MLLAGSRNMAGAAVLSARAACRSGCGLVTVSSQECNRIILQSSVPEAMFDPIDMEMSGENGCYPPSDPWRIHTSGASSAGLGPGIGRLPQMRECLFTFLEHRTIPCVLDADALNLLSEDLYSEDHERVHRAESILQRGRLIVTPHPGEMARLLDCDIPSILKNTQAAALSLARRFSLVCVLKDHHTVVTDGRKVFLNQTGCSGMATGGSGDVLTGLVTGLLAQGMDIVEAAAAGVWLHGFAGQLAEKELGARGMTAGDIIKKLPAALIC